MWMHVDAFAWTALQKHSQRWILATEYQLHFIIYSNLFEVGPTYTLCFWGISQWLDKLNWQATWGKSKCHQLFAPNDL